LFATKNAKQFACRQQRAADFHLKGISRERVPNGVGGFAVDFAND
jgi:hypothetical protein